MCDTFNTLTLNAYAEDPTPRLSNSTTNELTSTPPSDHASLTLEELIDLPVDHERRTAGSSGQTWFCVIA
uniref:Pheromone Phb3.2 B47 n=1 Tax=Coprinopsis cinerea TaxID=5346 RepID=Q6TMB0_COPCI|nr:pheromone precursor Phb3.2 B47 [Coprinopsis cinerea]